MRIRDLLSVLWTHDQGVGADFPKMLDLASEMLRDVDRALWSGAVSEDLRQAVYARDRRLGELERAVRRDVITHLSCASNRDVAYCLILVNAVKDAERIGDYVKNLVDPVVDLSAVPDGALRDALRGASEAVVGLVAKVRPTFERGDEAEAEALLREGRQLAARCERLLERVAAQGLPSGPTTTLALVARAYKRLAAHSTNILSAVVVPVHEIDFFDEKALDRTLDQLG